MSLVYFDTSALLKLVLPEPSTELMCALWNRADAVVTSRLADAELRAVLRAGERSGHLTDAQYAQALERWQALWPALRKVEVTAGLADRAAALAEEIGLRAGDGLHLAAALLLEEAGVVFAAAEGRLAEAARDLRLHVLP